MSTETKQKIAYVVFYFGAVAWIAGLCVAVALIIVGGRELMAEATISCVAGLLVFKIAACFQE